jgi:glutaredoxin
MKGLVFVLALCVGAFYLFGSSEREYDEGGVPKIVIFTIDDCEPCDQAINQLKRMRINFEVLQPMKDGAAKKRFKPYGKPFGGQQFPVLVVGDEVSIGYTKNTMIETYAKAFGLGSLGARTKNTYNAHFEDGKARVVMYGTSWCGFCAKARKEFAASGIDYIEWDVENNSSAAARFDRLNGNGYPLIYVGFERLNSVDVKVIRKALMRSSDPV